MQKLYLYLTYLGAMPFVLLSLALALGHIDLPWLGNTEDLLSTYALLIITFLAGAHWGQHLPIKGVYKIYLPLFSNSIVVFLWLAYLLLPLHILLIIYAVLFLLLLLIDRGLFQVHLITRHYLQTRCWVTAVVLLSLLIAGIMTWSR